MSQQQDNGSVQGNVRHAPWPAAGSEGMREDLERLVAERTRSLIDHQEELRHLGRALALAEQRERRRIAMELHDYLAQILVACRMKLDQLQKLLRSDKGRVLVDEIQQMMKESLTYTRTLIAELSPSVLYEAGLPAAIQWLCGQMRQRGLSVDFSWDGQPVALSEDEAVMVFTSVRELLLNVVRHAETSSARVDMRMQARALAVTVSDSGKGFASGDNLPGPATSGKYGLFNVQERIRTLRGRFEVVSEPGQGTRATLTVPVLSTAPNEEALHPPVLAPRLPAHEPEARGIMRVLLVDDHAMIRKALRGLLENYDDIQIVGEAADGEEAVAMSRSLRPDAVIMDINMPRMNGIEATRRVRRELPGIVIVGLSVYDDKEVAASMREAGAAAFLFKGCPPEEIYQTLRTARAQEQLFLLDV